MGIYVSALFNENVFFLSENKKTFIFSFTFIFRWKKHAILALYNPITLLNTDGGMTNQENIELVIYATYKMLDIYKTF